MLRDALLGSRPIPIAARKAGTVLREKPSRRKTGEDRHGRAGHKQAQAEQDRVQPPGRSGPYHLRRGPRAGSFTLALNHIAGTAASQDGCATAVMPWE
jgi:hypothetical protein